CDDGDYCNGAESCESGVCQPGSAPCSDDGLDCTQTCDGFNHLCNVLMPGHCLIDGACYGDGEPDPGDPCQECDPSQSTSDWTRDTSNPGCWECSLLVSDDFEDGTVAPWVIETGNVSVTGGRLLAVRTATNHGTCHLDTSVSGGLELEVDIQLYTSNSTGTLCLRTGLSGMYCLILNTMTENGAQKGAHFMKTYSPNATVPPETRLIETFFDPGTSVSHHLKVIRSSSGDWELFVDGASVGTANDTEYTSFDRLWINGFQDSNGGHGAYFDNVVLSDCEGGGPACDITQVSQLNDLPQNLNSTASVPRDGRIYLVGGYETNSGASTQCLANVWGYDMASDTTTDLGEILPYAKCPQGAVEMTWADNGKLYMGPALGPTINSGWGSHRCVIEFDPAGPSAVERACFPSTRWNIAVVNGNDGYLYFLGGWNGGSITDIYRYDPVNDTLTDTGVNIPVAGNSIIGGVAECGDGTSYFWTNMYANDDLYLFDAADLSMTNMAHVGLNARNSWLGQDGKVYALVSDSLFFDTLVFFDPSLGSLETEDLGQNVFAGRQSACFSADTQAGHLYAFGGEAEGGGQPLDTVERTDCLPGVTGN
ncbi:MAG: hypothetical protein JXR96_20795, partial [Deltaproteobacteria bacterium]|nr:hypothetical protein [Deltaproteobacteria bacterium]